MSTPAPASVSPPAAAPPAAGAAFRSEPELESGYRMLYEQKFAEARARFSDYAASHPGDPFGPASVAAGWLFEEFYRKGILTSEYFLDDRRFLRGIDGEPDPDRMENFRRAIGSAERIAADRLARDPADPDALFALTLALGMHSNASSVLEKKQIAALRQLRRGERSAVSLLAARPDAADAWLSLGSANYIIGSVPATVRFFLWFGGIQGDRALGMEQLEKTASQGRYLRPYAKILLALAARREKQDDRARRLLDELTREFPESPLFAAERARLDAAPGSPGDEASRSPSSSSRR